MAKVKFAFFYLCLTFAFCFSEAQTVDKIQLDKIIFHSSRCNGTCPSIDLEIDSSKNIFVNREYYKSKSNIDIRFSGLFTGSLNPANYTMLIVLLQNCNLDTLKFPDITCCDGIITTIIIYYNGQRKYLKSMTPPEAANQLILFLNAIGNDKKLVKADEIKSIEQ
jgi:hypothetical protein